MPISGATSAIRQSMATSDACGCVDEAAITVKAAISPSSAPCSPTNSGSDSEITSAAATQAAIRASVNTPGLLTISAGNYGGRLGKSFIYLDPAKQPG